MAKRVNVRFNSKAVVEAARSAVIRELVPIGREVREFARDGTPFRTGFARRSVYFVVIDDRGNVVAGDQVDGNGSPVPRSFPQYGRFTIIVGANAPYYIWIEIGARGRPGRHMLGQARNELERKMKARLAKLRLR